MHSDLQNKNPTVLYTNVFVDCGYVYMYTQIRRHLFICIIYVYMYVNVLYVYASIPTPGTQQTQRAPIFRESEARFQPLLQSSGPSMCFLSLCAVSEGVGLRVRHTVQVGVLDLRCLL